MSDRLRYLVNVAGRVLSLTAIAFVVFLVFERSDDILEIIGDFDSVGVLWVIIGILLLNHVLSSWILAMLCGEPGRLASFIRVQALSQIAKYLPGNVFHFVGRIALAENVGLSSRRMSWITVVELSVVTGAGLIVALGALALIGEGSGIPLPAGTLVVVRILFVCFFLFGSAALLYPPLAMRSFAGIRVRQLSGAVLCYVPVFLGNALTLYFLANTNVDVSYGQATFVNTVAWVGGFLVPGAPGGIGIREALIYQLLSADVQQGFVVFLVVVLRLCSMVADILFYLSGLVLHFLDRRRGAG